jgi:hypothetical protein
MDLLENQDFYEALDQYYKLKSTYETNKDKDKLKIIKDVLLFISDVKVIFNPINKYGNIQYIGLTDISEKYN